MCNLTFKKPIIRRA
jgi:hypothetical protein